MFRIMTPKIVSFLFFIAFCLTALSQKPALPQDSNTKPKLVVGIVVDQMRYDYLTRFAEKYGESGFKTLLLEGHSFQNHFINYVPSKTAPGHATIHTGVTPSMHGIVNNSWYNKTKSEVTYSVSDFSVDPVGTGSRTAQSSPHQLLVETMGDINRKHTKYKGKTISISLKDRGAVLSGGKKPNAAYWFRGEGQGHWISSSYYMKRLPKWVIEFNEANLLEKYMETWDTFSAIANYIESGPDESPVERGYREKESTSFPYDLKTLAPTNGGYDLLKATPFGNSYTIDFALATLKEEALGQDEITDFLLISFSSTDDIGHNFGVDSKEVEDAYIRLDNDLARFIKALNRSVGRNNYTLFLTSDHGAQSNPSFGLSAQNNDAYFKEATFKIALGDFVLDTFGNDKIIEHISGNMIYLNDSLVAASGRKASEIEQVIKDHILKDPAIGTAATRTELLAARMEEPTLQMIQRGFHPKRSGDIVYTLSEGMSLYAKTGSSHGSPHKEDTHVPLLFYGAGIQPGVTDRETNPTNIAPTLAKLLGIPFVPYWKGDVLVEVFK